MTAITFKSAGQQEQTLELPEQPLTVLVHRPGTSVGVPGVLEISGVDTILEMKTITQKQWEHISSGPLFKELFFMCFKDDEAFKDYKLPLNIEEFRKEGDDMLHIAGLIILTVNAIFSGKHKKIFIKLIEAHLHPGTQQRVMGMMTKIQELLCGNGVEVKTEEQ